MKSTYAELPTSTQEFMKSEEFAEAKRKMEEHIRNDPRLRKMMRNAALQYIFINSPWAQAIRSVLLVFAIPVAILLLYYLVF